MIVDASAIVAVIRKEPEADVFKAAFTDAVHAGRRSRLSAAGYLETAMVIDGRDDPVLSRGLDRFLDTLGVEIVPLTRSMRGSRGRRTATSGGAAGTRRSWTSATA